MESEQEKQVNLHWQSKFRIFVSHSHKDNDFGIKLVNDLRAALGNEEAVWYDASGGLQGGEAWWQRIVREVRESNVFIVVLSPDAVESGWVNDEIDLAWQQKNSPAGMLIIPVLYRECNIRDDLKTRQIVSFLSPESYDTGLQELLLALEKSLYPKSKTRRLKISPLYSPPLELTFKLTRS
jgi:hypothetical protein